MKNIKIKALRPLYSQIVTTAERLEESKMLSGSNLIDGRKTAGALSEFQRVIAVGEFVKNMSIGDLVCIDPTSYEVKKYSKDSIKNDIESLTNQVVSYNFPIVEINNTQCLLLKDRDIKYVVEEFEEETYIEPTKIQVPENKIIL